MRKRAAIVILAAICFGALVCGSAAAKRDMRCNGAARLCDRPLNRVTLPAAHNAMSAASLGFKLPNQSVAIPEQLETGIRGLLFDTHYGRLQPDGTVKTDDDGSVTQGERGLYLCHVLCEIGATPLVPALHSIADFLDRHPNNVLTIINEDKISAADFASAVEESGLIDHAYSGAPGPKWPTLKRMIRRQQQVVMLAERDAGSAYPWYHNAYDGIVQETPFSFNPPTMLTDPANWPGSCQPNRDGTNGSLFLINHWSPSTAPEQTDFATSEAVNARDVIYGRAQQCIAQRGLRPSLIAVDQFAIGGLFAAVRQINGVRR